MNSTTSVPSPAIILDGYYADKDDDVTSNSNSSLSSEQELVMSVLSLISALLSILGSSMIIYLVVKKKSASPRDQGKTPYKRLMLGLSLCDILQSLTYIIGPFMLPSSSNSSSSSSSQSIPWSKGNDTTCSILGLLTQVSISVIWYNGFLSLYYLLTIRFAIPSDILATKLEPFAHSLSLVYNFITATWGFVAKYYTQLDLGQQRCWINKNDENVPTSIQWIFGGIPMLTIFVTLIVNNIIIGHYIQSRTTMLPSGRKTSSIGGTAAWTTRNTTSSTSSIGSSGLSQQQHIKRTKILSIQSFLYFGSFLLCYTWTLILRLLQMDDNPKKMYPLLVIQSLFVPLQGFLNLIIYSGPNYMRLRHQFPDKSKGWIIKRVWFGPPTNPFVQGGRFGNFSGTSSLMEQATFYHSNRNSHHNNSTSFSGNNYNIDQLRARAASQFTAVFSTKDPLRQDYLSRRRTMNNSQKLEKEEKDVDSNDIDGEAPSNHEQAVSSEASSLPDEEHYMMDDSADDDDDSENMNQFENDDDDDNRDS